MTTDHTPDDDLAPTPPDTNADRAALLEQERDEMKALALRARADYDNLKRRTEEERLRVRRDAVHDAVLLLLPSLDDLERAVGDLPPDAPPGWAEGVRLVLQNILAFVDAAGVDRIDPAAGDDFDPVEHEAVAHLPSADHAPGSVLATFRPGYRGADRVLRPAQVAVAREPEPAHNDNPNNHTNPQPGAPGEKETNSNG